MARRRLPRNGVNPSPRAARGSDSSRVSGKARGVGAEVDWTSVIRVLVLVGVAGGVAAFLFYPDIARLVERWQNASRDSSRDPSHNEAERHVRPDPDLQNSRPPLGVKPGGDKRRAAGAEAADDPKRSAASSTRSGRETTKEAPEPNRRSQSGPKASNKRPTRDDLMEGEEEEEEEEDFQEVELMEEEEEEEPVLQADIEDVEEDAKDARKTHLPYTTEEDENENEYKRGSSSFRAERRRRSARKNEESGEEDEPITLSDGQTITFTPVGDGDESLIRFGGRPKDNGKTKKPSKSKSASQSQNEPKSNNSKSDKTKSTKSSSEKQADTKRTDKASPNKPTGTKTTDTTKSKENANQKTSKQSKAKDSKPKGKKSASGSAPVPDDLPEEVKNFRPSYLRTVTAKKIFADGRRIPPVELLPQKETNSSVRVFLFNEFLSEEECDGLRRVHDKHTRQLSSQPPLLCFDSLATLRKHLAEVNKTVHVTPNDFIQGTRCVNASFSQTLSQWLAGNWSYSTAFYPGESRFSTIFEARVQQAMGLDPKNGGKFQITSYPTGKAYKAHTDCILGGTDKRDRVATVLVYLDDVDDGGETKFPELGVWVKPRKGRALVWNNMSPDGVCEPHSLHVASKVNKGAKYILIRWYYYKSFYSLGKRPPEPPIPARPPGTPRVSCDDYDNGSCRWYDEWGNDHLLEYELKKYTLI